MTTMIERAARAIFDPGATIGPRPAGMPLHEWQARAAIEGIRVATAVDELRRYWGMFCDCCRESIPDDFIERMEAAGLVTCRPVEQDDIDATLFAADLGIEIGGMIWVLTEAGEVAHASPPAEGGR